MSYQTPAEIICDLKSENSNLKEIIRLQDKQIKKINRFISDGANFAIGTYSLLLREKSNESDGCIKYHDIDIFIKAMSDKVSNKTESYIFQLTNNEILNLLKEE